MPKQYATIIIKHLIAPLQWALFRYHFANAYIPISMELEKAQNFYSTMTNM